MKKSDITQSVMEKVSEFEEQRSKTWLSVFIVVLLVIGISIVASGYRAYTILAERHTLDLLEIFYQDREILAEFWQDTMMVALAELPQQTVMFGFCFAVLLVSIWVVTRHQRRIVKRRLTELAKRKKSSDNTKGKKGVL